MKEFLIAFFEYAGCAAREDERGLTVDLTADAARHFGKPRLRLVFDPAHLTPDAELATPGSYLTNRLHELIGSFGQKAAVTLPKRHAALDGDDARIRLQARSGRLAPPLAREILRSEAFLTFRVTYFSNEKVEELVTVGVDMRGQLARHATFADVLALVKQGEFGRFPFSKADAKAIYARCLEQARTQAQEEATRRQRQLAEQYHHDVVRLKGFYRQLIEEIPDMAIDREQQERQFQEEYRRKASDELQKCQVHVEIEPVGFCAVSTPFQRYRVALTPKQAARRAEAVSVDAHHNLFSGAVILPQCPSCGKETQTVGLCETGNHAVCEACLEICGVCGATVCHACGSEQCAECGARLCPACQERCHLCGKTYCPAHLLGCLDCRKHFCRSCSAQCAECGNITGNIHVIECDLSHRPVCFHCLVTCPCCDQHVGRSHSATCAFCGQQVCRECAFQCAECGQTFCVHHVRECEISGQMTCPRHSAVCARCERHVSVGRLRKCDVCRKTICAECAARCQGCGHDFCEEHREEMTACPECGRLYCALCYSGQGVCSFCQKKFRQDEND